MPNWTDSSQLESGKRGVVRGGSFVAGNGKHGIVLRGSSDGISKSIGFVIGLSRSSWGVIKTPLGLEGDRDLLGLRKLEGAGLLGNDGALVLGLQLGDELRDVPTSLLWVQVADFLGNIHKRSENFVMTFFLSVGEDASSTADLHGKLLTGGVADKLSRLLLNILCRTGRLIHSATLLGSLTVALLDEWSVTLFHSLVESLLLERNRTLLLKILLADFLLRRSKKRNIGVVTLLCVLVGTL